MSSTMLSRSFLLFALAGTFSLTAGGGPGRPISWYIQHGIQGGPPQEDCSGKVNSPTSRQCWSDGFDINTDYYDSWPDTGVTREYWLTVENSTLAPDGTEVSGLITINGTIPGPTIYADWGDYIKIHVTNTLENNGTSLHWHGVRQLNSNEQDGTAGITGCPTAPGATDTYLWQATQYGTSWYHSHFTVQFGAGAQGPLLVNGPATMDYDEDLGVMMLQDFLHAPSVFAALVGLADAGDPITMSSGLINGTNNIPCDPATSTCGPPGKYWETTVYSGKTYMLRLANGAVQTYWRFMIDNHKFFIIATDYVPVRPQLADSLVLGEGQRYDIVFKADQDVGNYWLRALWQDCPDTALYEPNRTLGIIRYDGADQTADPTSSNWLTSPEFNECGNRDFYDTHIPWLPMSVGQPVQQQELLLGFNEKDQLWTINGSNFLTDWTNPTINILANSSDDNLPYLTSAQNAKYWNKSLIDKGYDLPDTYNGTQLNSDNIIDVPAANEWVWFYWNDAGGAGEVHPMHLHGHDFWIIHQSGDGHWAPGDPVNLDNPPRRDVANLLPGGSLVLAFYTDNPGIWLLHCHIAWHVSQGLSVQYLERAQDILPLYNLTATEERCATWDDWVNDPNRHTGQDDSGV